MIDIIVLILLIIFVIYTIIILAKSIWIALINIILIWAIFARAFFDLKKKELIPYYLGGALFAIALFISQDYISFVNSIFKLMRRLLILETVQILLLALLFSNLFYWIGKTIKKRKK